MTSLAFYFKKVRGRGGGAYLLFWSRGWALNRGRAFITAWALIRENTIFITFLPIIPRNQGHPKRVF